MNWKNLITGKCPNCGKKMRKLIWDSGFVLFHCAYCDFKINGRRRKEIISQSNFAVFEKYSIKQKKEINYCRKKLARG